MPWLEALYPRCPRAGLPPPPPLDPDNYRLACRMALTELLLSGCTTASDHPRDVRHPGLETAMDIQAEEAAALGMRMTLVGGSRDLGQKDGLIAPENVVEPIDRILAASEDLAARYHDPSDGVMVQVAFAPDSPFTVNADLMRETAALAERCGCQLHTHLSPERPEEDRPLDRALRQAAGRPDARTRLDLGSRLAAAHAIHLDDAEIATLGRLASASATARPPT